MSVVLELVSPEEKNVISTALAIGLVATEGIGEWKSTRGGHACGVRANAP